MFALVPVVFTAAGSAIAQVLALPDDVSLLVIALAAFLSALVAVGVMAGSPQRFSAYGLTAPLRLRSALWLIPVLLTVVIALSTQISTFEPGSWLPSLLLAVSVALNEELWFRGIVLHVLRVRGVSAAIYGSAALFGVLHLANLAGGQSLVDSGLQFVFAVLFGIVAAQLVVMTRSLWPAIGWHAGWDFVNTVSGNHTSPMELIGIGVALLVMFFYSLFLARQVGQVRQEEEDREETPR